MAKVIIPEKFVHLHLHTQFSALDGAIKIKNLMPRLKELGMNSCAITDHGTMSGILDFYKACKDNDIHPVIGSEFYISPNSRHDRTYEKGQMSSYHLVLLAENNTGLKNLYELSTISFLEGFYRKPRIDKEVLAKHSEGVIALSACLAGEISRRLLRESYNDALEAALEYDKIMGRGNFFLEIQENGIPEQTIVNRGLISISKETGIPLVATCDCHYMTKEDHPSHNILMQVQYNQGVTLDKRRKVKSIEESNNVVQDTSSTYNSNGSGILTAEEKNDYAEYSSLLYVKSPEEINNDFSYAKDAIENTVKIAKRCNVSIEFGVNHLPKYSVPDGYTIKTYFEKLAKDGLEKRLLNIPKEKHEEYYKRLAEEIEVITLKGFDGYFLIVWDFINYARRRKIPVGPGRGSGAGSLVAYALEITDIDPIRLNLLFERFLNPERESMPDFDIDFCINGREEVIKYVTEKYGSDKVCQIITFGTLKPRNAIRDIGRAFDVPLNEMDKLAKAIPADPSISSFKKAFDADPTLMTTIKSHPMGETLLKHAMNIEGLIRNIGIHAAGVIIADKPIREYAPLCRGPKGEDIITQFEKGMSEKIGLIKFDFLGLKNLTIIDNAIKNIHNSIDPNFDISKIPLDDEDVFDLLQRGDTIGVFQLESEGMKNLLKKLRPTVFEDIIAANALYRPGPINSGMLDDFVDRKHGNQEITYILPELESILKETYGIIVYQEQVMQIACLLGGYTLGSADILRRAMGKKDKDEMARQRLIFLHGNKDSKKENEKLIVGAIDSGYDEKKAGSLFDLMEQFAEYGFNKSHSAAYALVAYQTAYLKAKYPLQYMAALISGDLNNTKDVVKYIAEAVRMGIKVLPCDINKSYIDFRMEDNSIRFGMGAVKTVGTAILEDFIRERDKNGEYKSIYDFSKRIDYKNLNRRAVEALIKAGAFDSLGKNRRQYLQVINECLDEGYKLAKIHEKGEFTLEDFMDDEDNEEFYPDVTEMPEKELLKMEKEVLGFYFSGHPLKELNNFIKAIGVRSYEIKNIDVDEAVTTAGMIKAIRHHITQAKKEKMAFITLEDLEGEVDVIVFPRVYSKIVHLLVEDNIIVVKGKVNKNGNDEESCSIRAEEVYDLGEGLEHSTKGVTLRFDLDNLTKDRVFQIKTVLSKHSGSLPVRVSLEKPHNFRVMLKLSEEFRIRPTVDFLYSCNNIPGFIEAEAITFRDRIFASEEIFEEAE